MIQHVAICTTLSSQLFHDVSLFMASWHPYPFGIFATCNMIRGTPRLVAAKAHDMTGTYRSGRNWRMLGTQRGTT